MRSFLVVLFMVLMFATAHGFGFGTMVENSDKTVRGLSAEYDVYFFNMGDEELEVSIRFEGLERANYSGASEILVEPSERSEDAVDDWVLFDGNYVRPQIETFTIVMDREREESEMEFDLSVSAGITDGAESNIEQDVIHEREHGLRMETLTPLIDPEGSEDSSLWEPSQGEVEISDDFAENLSYGSEGAEENASNVSRISDEGSENDEGVNSLTVLLFLGVLLMAGYIYFSLI